MRFYLVNEFVEIIWGLDQNSLPIPKGVKVNGTHLTLDEYHQYINFKRSVYHLSFEIEDLINKIKNKHCICT